MRCAPFALDGFKQQTKLGFVCCVSTSTKRNRRALPWVWFPRVVEDGRACTMMLEYLLTIVAGEVLKDVVEDVRGERTVVGAFMMAHGFEGVA